MDETLKGLLRGAIERIDTHTGDFRDGRIDADTYQRRMAQDLTKCHAAAYLAGKPADDQVIRAADKRILTQVIGEQIDYLNKFADDLQAAEDDDWTTRHEARARLYAGALKHSYWRAKTFGRKLPAYPGDGTSECIVNCGCIWQITDEGAFWRLGPTDHCATCTTRAATWNPYREDSDE